jgi:hypothetical protein
MSVCSSAGYSNSSLYVLILMGGSAHLSFSLGVITAAGGIMGYIKVRHAALDTTRVFP